MKKRLIGLISLLCLCVACFSLLACGGPKTFKVTTAYDSTKGTVSVSPEREDNIYNNGEEITVTVNGKGEYLVKSVKANGVELVESGDGYVTKITEDTTISVEFKAKEYAITYELDGGTNGAGNPDVYTVDSETITLADAEKGGTNFIGWTTDGVTEPTKNLTIESGSTGNKTFTANYEYLTYNINYILNGGENHPDNPSTYTAKTLTFTLKSATKEGYDFVSWTDSNGEEVKKIVRGSYGDLELTANFELHKYKITYELAGGTTTNPKEYTIADEITLTDPEKSGSTFLYWADENGNRITDVAIPAGSTGDKKFVAVWRASQTITVYNDANFTANGVEISLLQDGVVKYSQKIANNKIYIEEFATGYYDIAANVCGYDFTLVENVNLKGTRYSINFDSIFKDGETVRYYTENGYAYIDLANGTFNKITEQNVYLDMKLNVSITETFYVAAYFEGYISSSIYDSNADMRFGIDMYNVPVQEGTGQHAVTFYKHPNSLGVEGMTIQQCVGKEGSWRTFQSGVSFDVLNDYGYWLIAKVDKENNIKSIYISDATGTYLLPGSATDTHAIFGNETLSVGIVYWKVEKVDEGMMMDAKYLRIASSLDEVIVTSEAIAVSVNNPDHATVSFEKDSYTVGENVVLNIVPEEGYYVNALTINGDNAIGSLANNKIELIALTDLEFAVSIEAVATEYHFTLNDFAPTTEQNQSVIIYNRMDNIIPSNFSDFIYTGKLGFSGPRTVSTPMIVCNNLKFFFEGANVTATSTRIVLNALTWGNDDTYVRMQWNMNGQSQPYVDDYASSRDEINWQRLWFEQGYIEVTVKFDSEKGLLEWGAINAEGNFVRVYSFYSKALEGAFLSRIEGEQTDVFKNYVLNAKTSDQEVNFYTEITSDIWDDVTMKAPADKERISSAIILNYAYSTESEAVHYRATLTNDTESRQTTNQWAGMRFVLCENGTGEYKTIEVQLVNWSQRLRFKVVNYIDGATKEVAIDSNPEFAQIQTDWYEGKSLTVELVYTHTAESGALTIYVYDSLGVKHTLLESANTATASVPLYGYARNMHFSADKTANWTFSDISVWVE